MSDPSIRCFLAVPVGDEVRDELARWQRSVRGRMPNARWVDPRHYHLTIKFYGEQEPGTVERLAGALDEALRGIGAFPVEVEGFGAFPNLARPRVLWAGVGAGADHLRRLAGIVEAASVGLDIPADRRDFHPHLTLARFRVPARGADIPPDVLSARQRRWGGFETDRICLMQSRLTPNGAHYTTLYTFALTAPRQESL